MSLNYIITFDYELFGSGKGCVRKHLVNPTNKILTELKDLDVKATFFIEQLEIDAIISLKSTHKPETKEYCDAVLLEQQILNIAKQGHDIQLHLHPQWFGAKYENGQWQLNFEWWRFSALPYRTDSNGTPGKYDLLKKGKASLEKLVRQVVPNYVCKAFRAGGYNVGSDKDTVKALADNGIKIDSSVCPGYFTSSILSEYDYTQVDDDKPYWQSDVSLLTGVANNVASSAGNKVYELPLLTAYSNFKQKLSLARVYNKFVNKAYKSTGFQDDNFVSKTSVSKVTANSNYDICLASNAEIKQFNTKIAQRSLELNNQLNVVTLIGHPKDFNLFSPMTKILNNLIKENVITVDQLSKELENV